MSKPIQTNQEFFLALKKLVTESIQKSLNISTLKVTLYGDALQNRIIAYLANNTKQEIDRMEASVIMNQIQKLKKGTPYENKFCFYKNPQLNNYFILKYDHCPQLKSEKDVLTKIQKTKNGVYLEEDMMRNGFKDMRIAVASLLQKRQIMPLRTKKAKKPFRDSRYQWFYLYPFEKDLKQNPQFQNYFVNKLETKRDDLEENERKFEIWFETKSSVFRKKYEEICSLNIGKQTEKKQKSVEKPKKSLVESIDEINFKAIPNLQMHLDLSNRKQKPNNKQ